MSGAGVPPLVAHVVYRFDTGGLENGVANLINSMPRDSYRHVVIALTEVTSFRKRIHRDDVKFISMNKPPGHALRIYPALYNLFRELQPTIVHSRNIGTLEVTVPAWLAGVPVRIHGEHGRDVGDLDGNNVKYQWVRRLYRPFVSRFVALSRDLENYLVKRVGVSGRDVTQLYNGVDMTRFSVARERRGRIAGCPFDGTDLWLLGTVGRMQAVKDQTNLARAFVQVLELAPELRSKLRLVMIGSGPLREVVQRILHEAGVADLAWLPGERDDVPDILRGLDCFVLPSLAEGISNTILEAMASGLPVIATDVGGNRELVEAGATGRLVPAADSHALAAAILEYAHDRTTAQAHGRAGRVRVEQLFSLSAMSRAYQDLYDSLLAARRASG